MAVVQNIVVDMSTRGAPPVAYSHQNDEWRTFHFEIYNNGEAVDLAGWTCKVGAILPDGNGGYTVIAGDQMQSASINENVVSATLTPPYTSVAGRGILTLIMTTDTHHTIRPINIDFRVQKSADGDDVIAGASDFPEGLEAIAESVFQEYLSTYLPPVAPSSSADANKAASAKLTGQELDNLKSDLLELQSGGYVADQQRIGEKINEWLDDHPEATTTVQDGAITEIKFADSLKLKTIKDYVTPEMFGAKGDGVTNDSTAIQEAINSGKTVFMSQKYLIGSTLNVETDNTVIYVTGEIVFDSDITIFNIESSYNTIVVNKLVGSYRGFEHDSTPNGAFVYYGTAFKFNADGKNVDHNYIFVQSCEFLKNGFLFYANGTYGCTYQKIVFGIVRAMYGIHYVCGSSERPWINENTFTGGRLYGNYGLYVRKGENQTDPFNGNKFYNVGFELLYQNAIDCEFFTHNVFENIRTSESLFGDFWINFSADCQLNIINTMSGVFFSNLNDLNNSDFPNIYRFSQIIFPYTWGNTQKTIFFGDNQIVKHTRWGWCAESARLGTAGTADLSIVGVSGEQTQYDLPHFGLYGGYNVTIDTTNGVGILNLPNHDGFGYGDVCHKIFIRVLGGNNRCFVRINGMNHAYTDNAGYYVFLYLNSADWKLIKLSD